jgi:hypothetical protein
MPRILLAGVVILALLISGCKIGGHNSSSAQANLRVVNLAALDNFAPISLTLNATPEVTGISFETITPYTGYDSGDADTVVLSNASNAATLYTSTITFNSGTNYTLLAYGSSGQPNALLLDDNAASLTLNSGYFEIRPVHTASGTGALDFYAISTSTSSCASGASSPSLPQTAAATFPDVGLGGIPVFQQFPAGCYVMYATQSGTRTVIYQSAPYTFNAGDVITYDLFSSGSAILVNGYVMNQNSALTSALVPNLLAQIKVTNASTTTGAVGMQVNGFTAFPSVAFGSSSNYIQVAAGTDPAILLNSSGAVVGSESVVLAGGGDYSTVILGSSPNVVLLVLQDNNLPPVGGDMKIRFVNATTNVGSLDIQVNSVNASTGLAPTAASIYYDFPQNSLPGYSIQAILSGTNTIAFGPTSTGEVLSGATYTYYIIGNPGSLQGVLSRDN